MISYRGFNSNEAVIYFITYFNIFYILISHLDIFTCEMPLCDLYIFFYYLFLTDFYELKKFFEVYLFLFCLVLCVVKPFLNLLPAFFHSICGVF